jgi:histidyl-tRNA synthetase
MRTTCSPTEFLRIAGTTAEHFGFRTIESLSKDEECKNCTVPLTHTLTDSDHTLDAVRGHLSRGVLTYCEAGLHAYGKPVLLYSIDTTTDPNETAVAFHIFNVPKSIAEAILIQTTRALATELGQHDHVVRINSLGDTESITRYSRELTNFLRKRIDVMSPLAREQMKSHAMFALQILIDEDNELVYKAPNPLEYLSDQSRKHFRDIIEYLDMSETPYEIDAKMLGHHEYYSDALFSIDTPQADGEEGGLLTVRGGRFDNFLERKTKKKTTAVGAVVILGDRPAPARTPRIKLETPSVYIIQLGFGPKVRSLMIVDELRKAGIAVMQDLANDSLSAQLRDAEGKGVKHVIIIGQKEFVDGTVILRDMDARKQEAIANDTIVRRLRKAAPVLVN